MQNFENESRVPWLHRSQSSLPSFLNRKKFVALTLTTRSSEASWKFCPAEPGTAPRLRISRTTILPTRRRRRKDRRRRSPIHRDRRRRRHLRRRRQSRRRRQCWLCRLRMRRRIRHLFSRSVCFHTLSLVLFVQLMEYFLWILILFKSWSDKAIRHQ